MLMATHTIKAATPNSTKIGAQSKNKTFQKKEESIAF
jgi:hypothetical protein